MTRQLSQLAVTLMLIAAMASTALADDKIDNADTDSLITAAHTVLGRKDIDKNSEKRLEQIVLTLGSRPVSPAALGLMQELSTRLPPILIPAEEGGVMIPFVDVGATARFTLQNWARRSASERALRATRAGDTQFLQNYFSVDSNQRAGMVDAIRRADPGDLVRYRDQLTGRFIEPGGDRLAAEFAVALADTALFERVIVAGSATVALDTVKRLEKTLGGDAALALMRLAIERADIASATLYQVGRLTPSLPAAELLLWELLADPRLGGSAAAVLARYADSTTINRLTGLLQNNDRPMLQKRALLALKLSGDSRAGEYADQWQKHHAGANR